MKNRFPITLMSTAVSLILLCPSVAKSQDTANPQTPNDVSTASSAGNAALPMAAAQAALTEKLDAKKDQVGQEFHATLSDTVHLKNGPELPHGTQLVGTIVADNTQTGAPTLALRFTKAQLKNGQVVPIKALIVGFASPGDGPPVNLTTTSNDASVNPATQIDVIGVLSGIDLHSKADSANSGAFVATKKNDIKLMAGSQFALAISAEQAGA